MAPGEEKKIGAVEDALQWILYGGVVISIVLSLIGLLWLAGSGQSLNVTDTESLRGIVDSIASLSPLGFISLGIVIIIATPIVRIIMTAVYFARRDRLLTLVPIVVLALIVAGFLISLR